MAVFAGGSCGEQAASKPTTTKDMRAIGRYMTTFLMECRRLAENTGIEQFANSGGCGAT
jgi:hypothetical protein